MMMYCEREKSKTRQRSYVYESKTENEKTKEKEKFSYLEMKQEQERFKQEEIVRSTQLEKERKIHYETEKTQIQDFPWALLWRILLCPPPWELPHRIRGLPRGRHCWDTP